MCGNNVNFENVVQNMQTFAKIVFKLILATVTSGWGLWG